jgi:hypothetical protein
MFKILRASKDCCQQKDSDIMEVEIEEAIEELENDTEVISAGEEDEEATDDEQDALPSFLEVESNFLSTRRYAESVGVAADDLQMLDRFQARLRRQRLQRLTSRFSSAPTLHRFFPPVVPAAAVTNNNTLLESSSEDMEEEDDWE